VAGVPAQIGLYAVPLALIGYALFGGSRLLVFAAAGSVAAVSAGVVTVLHPHGQSMSVTLTAALALGTVNGTTFLNNTAWTSQSPLMEGYGRSSSHRSRSGDGRHLR
jgi:hypothetical protein